MTKLRSSAALAIALVVWIGVAMSGGAAAGPQSSAAAPAPAGQSAEKALVNRYCVTCHNERRQVPAGAPLLLDKLNIDQVSEHPEVWEKVVRKVRSGAMPPVSMPRPEAAAFRQWVTSLEGALDRAAAARPAVGRPAPVHRLNRAEYANAVRDLLGLEVESRGRLPADDSGCGFDNIGDVLSVSPGLLERYMLAAAKISRQALGDPTLRPATITYKVSPYFVQADRASEDLPFGTRGGLAVRHHFPLDGEYAFKIVVKGPADQQRVELRVDRANLKTFELGSGPLEIRTRVSAGPRLVGAAFVSAFDRTLPIDGRPASVPVTSFEFSQSAIDSIQISGPYGGTVPDETPARARIFVCEPTAAPEEAACAKKIVSTLARRAYRRPVTDVDL